ncbi:MAG TPA: phosphohistidine phosphatase SixA [Elusimicrobia bacterium]|jgi:phosphohistidine phosphatase|nr:phosphohistidine phosphatase SixA [Elusimicrobiota bacterium]
MRLYLVQHGEAHPEQVDPSRPLTEKGRKDVSKVAKFLEEAGIQIDTVWHSTKTRAIQTAEILAEAIKAKNIEQKEGLTPNDSVGTFKEELASREKDLMIVGHLPFLQKLASLLLTGSESQDLVAFQQAGIVCLEREQGKWQITWMIIPELIA